VIPHVEDAQFVQKAFDSIARVGIVASANRINLAIVRDCLEAIDRRLDGACPFTVHVAGQVKDMVPGLPKKEAAIFSKPWVRMHGFVPDIAQFYADMDLVISPVTMGTGINVKTVQAMAFGMPLLTTAWGSKGIETDEPLHAHTDLDALAGSLMRLVANPGELQRLATISRTRYKRFLEDSQSGIEQLFRHPKLLGQPECRPLALQSSTERVLENT
jgi:glycosyltransferase involved in cell wall biosynthesis